MQRGANFVLKSSRFALRVEATDGNAAAVGVAEAFEDFNGSGFAGAIRPEQAENFSFFDVEADATNGFDVAIALDEILHLQNGIGHVVAPHQPGRTHKRAYSIPQISGRFVTREQTVCRFICEYAFSRCGISAQIF